MNKTCVHCASSQIQERHEEKSHLQLWVEWRLEMREEDLYGDQGTREHIMPYSPLFLYGEKVVNCWTRGLVRCLPKGNSIDHGQLWQACREFFEWCHCSVRSWKSIVDYQELFALRCPELVCTDVNLRDAHFIVWFINNRYHEVVLFVESNQRNGRRVRANQHLHPL